MDERLVTQDWSIEDGEEKSIRPLSLQEYIGQEKLKEELEIYIAAAKHRDEPLDHVLLYGPPGLGKTTMANIIANELGVGFQATSGPAIEKSGDLVSLLNELQPGDVLFIDEIHRLPKLVEEMLYTAMEDYYVDIIAGQGEMSHPIRFPVPPFTLVGATTRAGMLSAPLRARFGILGHMEYYSEEELATILFRSAAILETEIDFPGAKALACRSRGTPRIANRLLKRVRDYALIRGDGMITEEMTQSSLSLLGIDEAGLDATDQQLLKTLIEDYHGGPVGMKTLAMNISEEYETLEDMYEPYLLQQGFLQRTPRGRIATRKSYEHFGYPFPEEA